MSEIVDCFFAVALAIDDGGDFEPDQIAFVVVVAATAPIQPAAASAELPDGGVEKRAASPARATGTEGGGDGGENIVILLGSPQAAAGSEHGTKIIREAFVNPEQIGFHGNFVIRSGQVRGTPEFSIPGVHEFVSEQAPHGKGAGGREHNPLGQAAIV